MSPFTITNGHKQQRTCLLTSLPIQPAAIHARFPTVSEPHFVNKVYLVFHFQSSYIASFANERQSCVVVFPHFLWQFIYSTNTIGHLLGAWNTCCNSHKHLLTNSHWLLSVILSTLGSGYQVFGQVFAWKFSAYSDGLVRSFSNRLKAQHPSKRLKWRQGWERTMGVTA